MAVNQAATQQNNAEDVSVLRIGVVKDSQIVDERLIPIGEGVSIGTHKFSTILLEGDLPQSMGEKFYLFESRGDQYYLSFNEDMKGVVKTSSDSFELEALIASQRAAKKGKNYTFHLEQDFKGKVEIGDYSFLFQFVAVPAVALKDDSVYKPRYLEDDDYVFLSFLGLFGMIAMTALIWISNQERPELLEKEEVEKLMAQFLDVPPEKPEETIPEPDDNPEPDQDLPTDPNNVVKKQSTETTVQKAPEKEVPSGAEVENKASAIENMSASDKAAAQEAVSNSAAFQVFGTMGKGQGVVASAFGAGSGEETDLDAVLDGVTDVRMVKTKADLNLKGQTDKSGRASADAGVVSAGKAGKVSAGSGPKTTAPKANAKIEKIDSAMGSCSDGINKTVRKYLSQVTNCHNTALKDNPNVAGRVVVDVEILDGQVTMAKVSQNKTGNAALGKCIEKRIKRWRFPADCSDIASFPFALSPKK